jgi:hypothetical protein
MAGIGGSDKFSCRLGFGIGRGPARIACVGVPKARSAFMPEVTCPNCREVLDVPAELAGSTVRCGACQFVIEPGAGRVPTVPRAEPARRPELRDDSDLPDELPQPKKSLAWLWILLGVGGFSCVGCCGLVGFLGFKVENPTWTKYTAPDGAFTVDFPGDTPQTLTRPLPLPGDKPLTLVLSISERKLAQERYAVGVCDLPKIEEKIDKALAELYIEACLNGLKNQPGTTVKELSRTNITLFGQPGKEYVGTFSDSNIRNGRVTRRIFVLNNKLYMLSAMGRDTGPPSDRIERFFSSFEPADAAKKP